MAKPSLLNVREHLKHIQMVLDAYEKYGSCPMIDEEIRRARLINRKILEKHNKSRKAGNRKDLRVGVDKS